MRGRCLSLNFSGIMIHMALMAPEKITAVKNALNTTWNYIAQDMFGEGMPKSMPRSHVIEVVLDASYLEYHGKLDKEILKEFRALSYKDQIKIARMQFTFARYGN